MIKPEDIKRFDAVVKKIQGKEEKGEHSFMGLCPCHGDARLSLWIKLEDDGKITLHCHAGCACSDICASIGIKLADLYPTPKIVALFDFINLDADLLFQEVKYDKTALNRFRVRRPGKKKEEWIWDVKGIGLILYNLYDVAQTKESDIIFLCEGSKDARNLKYKGLTATSALWNNWGETDTTPLDHRPVVVLQDNDPGGETKALLAAHDRYGKSSSVKILLLPNLKKGGDVTDWIEAGGTIEQLLELVQKSEEWFPLASVRQQIKDGKVTGLSFEHYDPRPAFEEWYETYHPPEEGPLHFYDGDWLKGDMKTLLFKIVSKNRLLNSMTEFFGLSFNKKSKDGQELFKPTPSLTEMILKSGELKIDLDILEHPSMPIFNPFHMSTKLQQYEPADIVLLKSTNFYVPERCVFPRNMDACIAMNALPFDYDESAKCPKIDKAFANQWNNDNESIDMLLQFLNYYMKNTFIYKSVLCMIGESDSGKTQILELMRHFIGYDNCEALSLSKIGRPFELYRARNAKLLISDDLNLTKRDLQDGSIVENLKSIPCGIPIRIEKKNGEIWSRKLACQIIIAGNQPPEIQEFSNALSNRFKFLNFPHTYVRGVDMIPDILATWLPELAGLFNKALDAGNKLAEQCGFIEPKSSYEIRKRFEGGGNPVKEFARTYFDINSADDNIKWNTCLEDVKTYYNKYCEVEGITPLSLSKFYMALESIDGISRGTVCLKISNTKTGIDGWKTVKCWIGLRKKGTSGIISAINQVQGDEF